MFEKNAKSVNEALEKDFDRVKAQMSDIGGFSLKNFKVSKVKDIFCNIGGGFSEGVNILVRSLVGYLGNLMIMFVVTPLFFYGVIYFVIKRILSKVGISFDRRSIQNV